MSVRVVGKPWELKIKDRTGRNVWAETRETFDEEKNKTELETVLFVNSPRKSQPKIDVGVLRGQDALLKFKIFYAQPFMWVEDSEEAGAREKAVAEMAAMLAEDGWPEDSISDRAWGQPAQCTVNGVVKMVCYYFSRVAPFADLGSAVRQEPR